MSDAPVMVVTCGSCGSRLRVRGNVAGRIGKCPRCGVRIQIALPAVAPPAVETQQAVETIEAALPEPTQAGPEAAASEEHWEQGMSPDVLREIELENARLARQGSMSIGVLAFASLVAGAAVCFHVARYGGAEHWLVKRSIAAWLVGMMSAGAMLVSAGRRGGALRFLSAVMAGGAVVLGKLFAAPGAAYLPVDALFIALAIAGSTFTFLLVEPSGAHPQKEAAPASM